MKTERNDKIIKDYKEGKGLSIYAIAEKYRISTTTIRNILVGAGVFQYTNKPSYDHIYVASLKKEIKGLRDALQKIEKWELPPSGEFWDEERKEQKSYTVAYGWEGVKKYFQKLATEALLIK